MGLGNRKMVAWIDKRNAYQFLIQLLRLIEDNEMALVGQVLRYYGGVPRFHYGLTKDPGEVSEQIDTLLQIAEEEMNEHQLARVVDLEAFWRWRDAAFWRLQDKSVPPTHSTFQAFRVLIEIGEYEEAYVLVEHYLTS